MADLCTLARFFCRGMPSMESRDLRRRLVVILHCSLPPSSLPPSFPLGGLRERGNRLLTGTTCAVCHPLTRAVSEYGSKHGHDPAGANSVEGTNRQLENAARYRGSSLASARPRIPVRAALAAHWALQHFYLPHDLWVKTSGAPSWSIHPACQGRG